jgi:ABC-2 type transport system permease protein
MATEQQSDSPALAVKRGIGGWLILPAIGLILGPPLQIAGIVFTFLFFGSSDIGRSHPGMGVLLISVIVADSILFFYYLHAASLFFRKRISAPRTMIGLNLFGFFAAVFLTVLGLVAGLNIKDALQGNNPIAPLIMCAIWIPYFLFSKRVKATFSEPGVAWLDNVLLLARREISAYFVTPVVYIVMAVFLVLASALFMIMDFGDGAAAAMPRTFYAMAVIMAFLVPLLMMRALAEEKYTGTIESLLTTPVTDTQVVVAKFLGGWVIYALMLVPTLVYPFLLIRFGNPDLGPLAAGYLGLLLLGGLYVSVGLAASSLTKYQIISAVIGIVVLVFAWMTSLILAVAVPWLNHLNLKLDSLLQISLLWQFSEFTEGKVGLSHSIYFVAISLFMLFFTVKVLESRKWR